MSAYDPARGARFSTWLLAIAKHTLGDEIDKRMALKRGGGKRGSEFDETWMGAGEGTTPDGNYEAEVFRAKVYAAVRMVERECEFTEFTIYRMRVFDGMSGKDVAESVGTSEPTVSRRLTKVRDLLRRRLAEVVATYSFTTDEQAEAERNGLALKSEQGRRRHVRRSHRGAVSPRGTGASGRAGGPHGLRPAPSRWR